MAGQPNPESSGIGLIPLEVLPGPLPDGQVGEGLLLRTSRGDMPGILHQSVGATSGVVWVCGARGGFGGPGPGTYSRLAEEFRNRGITSLRLDYRMPSDLYECTLDLLAGAAYFKGEGYDPVVVVGHSFGGAVVIAAGAASPDIKCVVSLSPQTFGADKVWAVSPRPLLLVHGKADTRLPFSCAIQIHEKALEPKELVLYDGAEHRLEECREELEELLGRWIPDTLAAPLPA